MWDLRANEFGWRTVCVQAPFFPLHCTLCKASRCFGSKQHGRVAEIDMATVTEKYVMFFEEEEQEVDYSVWLGK